MRLIVDRTNEDINDLFSKIKESYDYCSNQLKSFKNFLFDTRNVVARGSSITELHNTKFSLKSIELELSNIYCKYSEIEMLLVKYKEDMNAVVNIKSKYSLLELMKKELSEVEIRRNTFLEELKQRTKTLAVIEERKKLLEEKLEDCCDSLEKLNISKQLTTEKHKSTISKLHNSKNKLQEYKNNMLESSIVNMSEEIILKSQSIVDFLKINVGDLKSELTSIQNTILSINDEIESLDNIQYSLNQNIHSSNLETINIEDQLKNKSKDIIKLQRMKSNIIVNISELEDELNESISIIYNLNEKIGVENKNTIDLMDRIQSYNLYNNEFKKENEEMQNKLLYFQKQKNSIQNELQIQNNLISAAIKEENELKYKIQKVMKKIDKVQNNNENLGNNSELDQIQLNEVKTIEEISLSFKNAIDFGVQNKENQLRKALEIELKNQENLYLSIQKECEEELKLQLNKNEIEVNHKKDDINNKLELMNEIQNQNKNIGIKRKSVENSEQEKRQKIEDENDLSIFDF